MINPYSTAFAIWWCHSGREWRMASQVGLGSRVGQAGRAATLAGRLGRGGRERKQWTAGEGGTVQHGGPCGQMSLADLRRAEA